MNIFKVLAIIVFILVSKGGYANCNGHKVFIKSLKQQVDKIQSMSKKGNEENLQSALKKMVHDNVDLKRISRFVIGKHWSINSKKEREAFLQVYRTYFAQMCIKILNRYISNSEMTIMSASSMDDDSCLIRTRFTDDNEKFTNIGFEVTRNDGSFLIKDIKVGSMSVSINQRNKFNEKIDTCGIKSVTEKLNSGDL